MPKLVNLGSLCIDFVYSVPHLVTAGETLASSAYDVYPGGKGLNQSLAAAAAGCEVVHAGAVGNDGAVLLDTLREQGVATDLVNVLAVASGHAVIQVDPQGRNGIVISGGANRQLDQDQVEAALDAVNGHDWLLLQNEINDLPRVIRRARDRGLRIALNLAPADAASREYPIELLDLLIVNAAEAQALVGHLGHIAEPRAHFARIRSRWPELSVVLTLGANGLIFFDAAAAEEGELRAYVVDAVDETAAGDAFVGYLLARLVAGESIAQALPSASAAGALATTRAGAAPSIPAAGEVAALMQRQTLQIPQLL